MTFFEILGLALLTILVLAGCCVAGVKSIRIIVGDLRKAKKEQEAWEEQEPALEELRVRVLDKKCGVKTYGTKLPQTYSEFYVAFLTQDGETLSYQLEEDVYLAIEVGQEGMLATFNGHFYGFVADEETE